MSAKMICDACGAQSGYCNGELPLGWRKVRVDFEKDHGSDGCYVIDICATCFGGSPSVGIDRVCAGLKALGLEASPNE